MTPYKSEDLTEVVEQEGGEFIVLRSPDTAEHDPDYRELGRFPTRASAEAFLESYDPGWECATRSPNELRAAPHPRRPGTPHRLNHRLAAATP
jgi:hypothetical protein